jgi:hypothetical protein
MDAGADELRAYKGSVATPITGGTVESSAMRAALTSSTVFTYGRRRAIEHLRSRKDMPKSNLVNLAFRVEERDGNTVSVTLRESEGRDDERNRNTVNAISRMKSLHNIREK